MDIKKKRAKLESFDEKTLRENVLVPMLSRLNFKAVTLYHGSQERGKDIVCFDYDRLEKREYLAVVAKVGDLDGTVTSSKGLNTIVYQIEQCFDVPYEDLFGMTRITMDRVWVVTTGNVVPGAANSIFDKLEKRNLSKLIRFISGDNLVDLIDHHFQSFWDQSFEPVEVLIEQKHRLTSFCRKILVSLGADITDIESTLNQVIHSSFPPDVFTKPNRYLF